MKIPLSTHAETTGQLLNRSLNLYRHAFFHVFFLSLLLSILVFIPRLITLVVGQDILNLPFYNPQILWLALIDFAGLLFFAALLWRIRCVVTDTHESIGDDMKIALKKSPYILIATLLESLLIITIGLFFFEIILHTLLQPNNNPVININFKNQIFFAILLLIQNILFAYAFLAFYFYLPIILIENKGILASLAKSLSLVWKNWWRTLWVQITPWVAYLFCLIALKYITSLDIHIYFMGAEDPTLLATCLHILAFAIFLPWIAIVMLVQLRDLELRKMVQHALHNNSQNTEPAESKNQSNPL